MSFQSQDFLLLRGWKLSWPPWGSASPGLSLTSRGLVWNPDVGEGIWCMMSPATSPCQWPPAPEGCSRGVPACHPQASSSRAFPATSGPPVGAQGVLLRLTCCARACGTLPCGQPGLVRLHTSHTRFLFSGFCPLLCFFKPIRGLRHLTSGLPGGFDA